ncbi:Os01g0182700 [Oryza sativa Japonica Group]|uniref:Os01g0182700 protein n=3 Tax=Oryza sativa subsp. japonica TaxID=39947 RepID=Q0JQ43_ORYSJ|nr:Os01g0182700 [Oryza sativa Japonica Group]|eukprot:NP_001042221.1 Os01g0182700 [Oryza sativa Japonica Group]
MALGHHGAARQPPTTMAAAASSSTTSAAAAPATATTTVAFSFQHPTPTPSCEEGDHRGRPQMGNKGEAAAAMGAMGINDAGNNTAAAAAAQHHLGVGAVRMKKVGGGGGGGGKARRKVREPRFCFKTMSDVDVLDDGYKWRKYGQKVVKNTQHPRSYYRCTQDNCRVKKRVERLAEDPRMVITTYEGRHVHSPSRDDDDAARASAEMTFICPLNRRNVPYGALLNSYGMPHFMIIVQIAFSTIYVVLVLLVAVTHVDSSLQGVYFGGNSSSAAAAAASQMSNQILIEFNQIYYFRFEFLKNHLNSSLMLTNFELARNQKTSSQISMGFPRNCISWLDTLLQPSPSTHASHLPPRGQLVASVDACGPSDADRIFPLRSTARETRSRGNINSSDLMDLSAIAIAHCISTKQPNHKVGASRERKKER